MVRSVMWRTSWSTMKPGRFATSRWTRGIGGRARRCWFRPQWIERVSWPDSKVYVDLTRETIQNGPEWSESMTVTREYENRLYDYYDRSPYWTPVTGQSHSHAAGKG